MAEPGHVAGRVFICHASEDAATARQVVEVLEAAGTACWIAPRNIPAGAEFTVSILEALAGAAAVVLIFSRAANASPHVRRELETAIGADTPILPVRLEDVDPSPSLRYFIGTSQWLDTVGVPPEVWGPLLVAGLARATGHARPALDPPRPGTPPTAPPATAAPRVRGLSPQEGTTWGREELLGEVTRLLASEGLVTLTGPGGVGKTRVAAELLARSPELTVLDDADPAAAQSQAAALATSRLPLGLPGERVVLVPPLDGAAAESLFLETAARESGSVDLTGRADEVAEVCRLLGGLPLGLTLAAGRLRVVGLDRLRTGLRTSLDLVVDLGTALAWSLERLDPADRSLLERLSLFSGPVPLDAVEAVADGSGAVDALTRLLDVGLVQPAGPEPLYALPHPVRLVALRSLENSETSEPAYAAVAAYLLGRVEEWRSRLDSAEGPDVVAAFSLVAPDVDAALEAAGPAGRTDVAVAMVVAAEQLWIAAGRVAEGRTGCHRVLEALPDGDPRAARLHAVLGRLAYISSEFDEAERELRTALRLGEEHGDEVAAATARCFLSGTLMMTGRVEEGTELAGRVHAETQRLGLYPQEAEGLFMLALSRMLAGDLAGEREAHEQRLAVVRRHGDVARTADALNTLAEIALDDGDPAKARRYSEESLGLAADRFPLERRDATITSARAAAALGDRASAGRLLADALAGSGGQALATAQCLRVGGLLAEAGDDPALAVRLFAAAQALSPSPTGTEDPPESDFAAALDRARAALGERPTEHEWTLGGALPLATMLTQLDDAIDLFGS